MKRWPLNKAYFWETIPFFRLLLPLVAGIVLYPFVAGQLTHFITLVLVALITCCGVYTWSAFIKQTSPVYKYTGFITLHLALIFAAWALCYYNDARNDPAWMGNSLDTADGYIARITETPAEKERTWKLEVAITHAVQDGQATAAMGKAFVYLYQYNAPAVREGDVLIIPNHWQRIKNSGNPFAFDYAAYTARDNIFYNQFLSGDEISIYKYAETKDLNWIRRVHLWCVQQLERYITDKPTSGLLKAILLGDKEQLDSTMTGAYTDTGIVHIMAISGAHITVFFLLVAFLLSWLKHRRYRWVKYMAALPLIWIYVVVAGAPTSAVRAATMFSLLAIGFALQKNPNGINQLLATAFMLLCIDPAWLYDIGFQLSFTAVLSIFLFYKWVYRWYSPVNKWMRMIWGAIAVSIAAELLVAPLVMYYFHLFPLQFIIANVLAYLIMSVILIGGMLLIAASSFYPLAHFIAAALTYLTAWFNSMIYWLQGFNPGSFRRITLTDGQLVLVYLCIASFTIFLLKKNKRALFIGLSAFSIFLLISCAVQWRALQQNIFIVYNTGKSNYIDLVQGRTATALYYPVQTDPKTTAYTLQPAHINLHIRDTVKAATTYNLIKLGGKTIFILDRPVQDTTLPADYVVINTAKAIDIPAIQQAFHPDKIIISSSISRNKTRAWAEEIKALGMQVHYVREDGAFVVGK